MKWAVEMGFDAVIYVPNLINIGPGMQNLIWGIHRHTESMVISYAYFPFFFVFKIGKVG
jgi:hypothetical protein